MGAANSQRRLGMPLAPRETDPPILRPELANAHVRLMGVGKTYQGEQGPVQALRKIELSVQHGEIFGIIGRSGAGKSSLIRTLNRLENPTVGRVLIDSVDIGTFNEDQLVLLRRRIGMIFQHFNLMSAKTVWQNVELPLKVAGIPQAERWRKVTQLLELVGLADKRDMYPAQLSGGQKQRVGIARALVHDPQILLCDEATSALDPETTGAILDLLRDINRRLGLTIVLITHEMSVIRDLCDRVVVLERGEIVEQGAVWQVFGNPRHPVSRTLLAPLQQSLPADLREHLLGHSPSTDAALVLRLGVTGEGAAPDLSSLFNLLGGQVTLLHGGVEQIQGRTLGEMIVSVRNSPHTEEQLLVRAAQWTERVEVLGHVA